ncbi:MAG: plasmid mobilization relaxosome protein MobC [Oscillospiraceae bacterium]|nr:plasmid mobilization relaxosome protein MobC [Oscillospiraceae bacterium]
MRKRTVPIQVFLSEKESENLKRVATKSGYSISAYIRSLLDGYIPQPIPPPDYYSMMNELRAVGNNMNQIAQKAHVLNVIDVKRYDEAYATLKVALVDIVNEVKLPRKIDRKLE